jgi:hypothetical protein
MSDEPNWKSGGLFSGSRGGPLAEEPPPEREEAQTEQMPTDDILRRLHEQAPTGQAPMGGSAPSAVPRPPRAADTEDEEDAAGEGFLAYIGEQASGYWTYAVAGVVIAVVLLFAASKVVPALFGGGDEAATAPQAARQAPQETGPQGSLAVRDTGIGIAEPVEKDGAYYLRSGEIAWKGKLENTDTGEVLTLEGPTAAQFKRAITLPGGSITTGVFGRAEPGKPILHATFHRVSVGEQEYTTGTYVAVDEGRVLVKGSYSDERHGDAVVRTYTEHAPGLGEEERYAVRFEAPPGVPIPALVGWQAPAPEGAEG